MPSLLKRLSKRRRRSSLKKGSSGKTSSVISSSSKSLPVPSISIRNNEDVVSPLKSTTPSSKSSRSLAFTDATSSTFCGSSSNHDSWSASDDSDAVVVPELQEDYAALIKARDPTKHIPPRLTTQSRWEEYDFLRVIWVWDLNQDEINKMRELEKKLSDITHWKNNPYEVVRFMKGPLGYKPAERLFRRMVDWRVRENIDTILQDYTPPAVFMDYAPSAILHGLDKDGDPIYLERAGAFEASGFLRHFGHSFMIRHLIWLRELCGRGEWIQEHEARMGRPITQVTIVYDLAGLNSRHLRPGVLPFFGHMMRLTQDYYTGPVKRMVIIRAPSIFRYVWAIAKNFFDPWAVAKMTFTGPHNHEEILSQFMDLEVLPACVCPTKGKGYAVKGMPHRFDGGVPPSYDYEEPIFSGPITQPKMIGASGIAATVSTISSTGSDDNNSSDDEEEEPVAAAVKKQVNTLSVSGSSLGSGFFRMEDNGQQDVRVF